MIGAPLMTKRSPLKVRSSGAPNYPVARWSKKVRSLVLELHHPDFS